MAAQHPVPRAGYSEIILVTTTLTALEFTDLAKPQRFAQATKLNMAEHIAGGWQKWRATALLCCTTLLLNVGCAQLSLSSPPQEWVLPVGNVPINSFYGEKHPFRKNRPHQGMDFGAKRGATVKAAQKGKVLIADAGSLNSRYGKAVLIDHGHGYQTLYAHLDGFYVQAGQSVAAGQPIGKVGSTGRVTGPHLHFELLINGKQHDPAPYLKL